MYIPDILSNVVPCLPVVWDPALFLAIYNWKSESADGKELRTDETVEFRLLALSGDKWLDIFSFGAISAFLGKPHRMASHCLEFFKSNEHWFDLANLYQLHRFVAIEPKNRNARYHTERFFADLCEAWWGALCLERDLWGENKDDFYAIISCIVYMRYTAVIDSFSTDRVMEFKPIVKGRSDEKDEAAYPIVEETLPNHPCLAELYKSTKNQPNGIVGYSVQVHPQFQPTSAAALPSTRETRGSYLFEHSRDEAEFKSRRIAMENVNPSLHSDYRHSPKLQASPSFNDIAGFAR
jgi:hypothetical protein